MQVGSLVECVVDFSDIARKYKTAYPEKGENLVVSNIEPHGNPDLRAMGIELLNFEEYPDIIGLCDKQIDGQPNFIELLPPADEEFHNMISEAEEIPSVVYL